MEEGTAIATFLGISERSQEASALQRLIEFGVRAVGAEEGSLLIYDEEHEDLVLVMTSAKEADAEALLGKRVPIGAGVTGLAAATQEVQIGAPTYQLKSSEGGEAKAPPQGEAILAAPMVVGEDLVGVITAVSFSEGRRFRSEDAGLYASVAAIGGLIVQQHRRIHTLEVIVKEGAAAFEGDHLDPAVAGIAASVARLAKVADLSVVQRLLACVEHLAGTEQTP